MLSGGVHVTQRGEQSKSIFKIMVKVTSLSINKSEEWYEIEDSLTRDKESCLYIKTWTYLYNEL